MVKGRFTSALRTRRALRRTDRGRARAKCAKPWPVHPAVQGAELWPGPISKKMSGKGKVNFLAHLRLPPLASACGSITRAAHMRRAMLVFLFFGAALSLAIAADLAEAVAIQGSGKLTICRSWLVSESCTTHKVVLPERVSVGDLIKLSYGSNLKNHAFRVARIRRTGEGCTILSENSRSEDTGERIEVARCALATEPSADTR
jgi:hypothetical protein